MLSSETPPHRRLRTPSACLNAESSWTSSGKKSPIKSPTLILVQIAAELQAAGNPRPALPALPQVGISDVAAEHHFRAGPSSASDLLLEDQQRKAPELPRGSQTSLRANTEVQTGQGELAELSNHSTHH